MGQVANLRPIGNRPAGAREAFRQDESYDRLVRDEVNAGVALAPEVFQLDDEDKATVIAADGAPIEDIQDAADRCPTGAITVTEA